MTDPGKSHWVTPAPRGLTSEQMATCFNYALSVLLDMGPMDKNEIKTVDYGPMELAEQSSAKLFFVASPFFYQWYGKTESLPTPPLEKMNDIPLIFGQPRIEGRGRRLIVHADIIASTYFLTTRYEEVLRPNARDEHGRFPGKESLAFRAGFLDRPIVEEYGLLLKGWMKEAGIDYKTSPRTFSVLLTHDVDHLKQYRGSVHYLRMITAVLRGKKPPRVCWEGPLVRAGFRVDPFDNFDTLLEMDEGVQTDRRLSLVKTVFFFLAAGPSDPDASYQIQDPSASDLVRRIIHKGHDIGLHASYRAGKNPRLLMEEKARLERSCGRSIHKNRHHYLAWREVGDGHWMKKAGLDWDATMGYADQAGFRLGVCRPIPLFDPVGLQYFGIEAHPLIMMEDTLGNPGYMNLPYNDAWDVAKKLLYETSRHHGEFVVLWHNHSLAKGLGGYYLMLYQRLLSEISKVLNGRTWSSDEK